VNAPAWRKRSLIPLVWLLLTPLQACQGTPQPQTRIHSDPVDFTAVTFPPGEPRAGEPEYIISAEVQPALQNDVRLMGLLPGDYELSVVGHTDNEECEEDACIQLGLRRADVVTRWFLSHGVPPERLGKPVSYGSSRPLDDNASVPGRARNRRAYVSIGGGP
jgi:outer membrane protein OmpA-like peptidoglycan-associated protein